MTKKKAAGTRKRAAEHHPSASPSDTGVGTHNTPDAEIEPDIAEGLSPEQEAMEKGRREYGRQMRGTGDTPPPVHGRTKPVHQPGPWVADVRDLALATPEELAERQRKAKRIMVQATQMGYYGEMRRRPGDTFAIANEKEFSPRWMVKVDPSTGERITTSKEALQQFHDQEHAARHARRATNPLGAEEAG